MRKVSAAQALVHAGFEPADPDDGHAARLEERPEPGVDGVRVDRENTERSYAEGTSGLDDRRGGHDRRHAKERADPTREVEIATGPPDKRDRGIDVGSGDGMDVTQEIRCRLEVGTAC